jgi:TolB protein
MAALLAAAAAVSSPRARAADSPRLLLSSARSGNLDIWSVDAAGGDARNLTGNAAADYGAAWSPDGAQIAFVSERTGNPEIYVMGADGSEPRALTAHPEEDRAPAWSPDGKRIAFCRHVNGNPEVFVMDADGGKVRNLSNSPGYDADPAWLANGKVLYASLVEGDEGFRFKVADPETGAVADGPPAPGLLGWIYPAVSPDGKRLAYTARPDAALDSLELFIQDLDGGNRRQLTRGGGLNSYAAWSPDGTHLAFQHHASRDGPGQVHVTDLEGKAVRTIGAADAPLEGGRPAWRPRK